MTKFEWSLMRMPATIFTIAIAVMSIGAEFLLSAEIALGILVSGLMCFVHVALGFCILELSFRATPTAFLKRVLGGMGIRLVVMLGGLVFFLKVQGIHETALMLGLLGWYALGLVFEVAMLNKKVIFQQQQPGQE